MIGRQQTAHRKRLSNESWMESRIRAIYAAKRREADRGKPQHVKAEVKR